jgi:hypothetical protein
MMHEEKGTQKYADTRSYVTNLYIIIASGVGLSPLYRGHFWPILPAPDAR